ncbi:MAG: prolipoprotein diacylglyceryl transferase [Clostridiales bacterium]|nr:prolipoprotein diacylglyceryl transferase [Clostridiales bacterium]
MERTLFGVIPIYGLLIAVALVLAILYCTAQEKRLGLPKDTTVDFALWLVPCALIGARLYYVVFNWDYYAQNPASIIKVWEGGMAIYGGVIGGAVAAWVLSRHKKIPLGKIADLVAPALILGQAIGRWGNFVNGEAYGRLITDPAWQFFPAAVNIDGAWHMATFFYESMWDFCGFLLLHSLRKKVRHPGDLFLGYLVWYGLGRAVIEGLRTDSLMWGPFRVSQCLSVALVLLGGIWLLCRYCHHNKKDQQGAV